MMGILDQTNPGMGMLDMPLDPSVGPAFAGMLSRWWNQPSALQKSGEVRDESAAMPMADRLKYIAANDPMAQAARVGNVRAFHGRPYAFDALDVSKIGSGEGAQAYGHGLYFAENEGTARSYRDRLSAGTSDITMSQDPENIARQALKAWGNDPAKARAALINQGHQVAADMVDKVRGSMYEVNIGAEPHQLLDWDKPLAQQPRALRDLLTGVPADPTGQGAYHRLAGQLSVTRSPEGGIIAGNPSPRATSQTLNAAGIPGIRYLDQGSRGAGT